ncbi:TPA: hypothetical protein ACYU77_003007 [Klebsiella variicola subsp. variicola]
MTTDITELAQSLKAAAKKLKEVGIIHNYSKSVAAQIDFEKYATPYNVIALVEALEKSEKTSEARREAIDRTHNMFVRERDRANAAEEALEKAQQRISQLESRTVTVKLPDIMPPEAAPAHYWDSGESMAYADGYNKSAADLKTSFAQACSFAGVNVEFE